MNKTTTHHSSTSLYIITHGIRFMKIFSQQENDKKNFSSCDTTPPPPLCAPPPVHRDPPNTKNPRQFFTVAPPALLSLLCFVCSALFLFADVPHRCALETDERRRWLHTLPPALQSDAAARRSSVSLPCFFPAQVAKLYLPLISYSYFGS